MFFITAFSHGTAPADHPITGLRQLVAQLMTTITAARRRRTEENRIRAELSTYSNRELAELGLSRGDIEAIARGKFGG